MQKYSKYYFKQFLNRPHIFYNAKLKQWFSRPNTRTYERHNLDLIANIEASNYVKTLNNRKRKD